MPQLTCTQGMTKGQVYARSEQDLLMGRNETNDIIILDNKASRTHCKVSQLGSDTMLTDMKSSNGVMVNNEMVKGSVLLKHNDVVTIGHTKYKLEVEMTSTQHVTKSQLAIDMTNVPTRRNVVPGMQS